MRASPVILILLAFLPILSHGQFVANYDESKVVPYQLTDPLISFDGQKTENKREWRKIRRPELIDFFTQNMYGEVPGTLSISEWKVTEHSDHALNGKARRKQIDLIFKKNEKSLTFNILIYLPKGAKKAPVFVGYNFYGNHTITSDTNVFISTAWTLDNPTLGITNHRLTKESRGVRANRWPVEKILDAGFGLATIYYGEVDPDRNDFSDGVHPFFYTEGQTHPADHEWGSIAAWAWGLSRAMDYFEMDKEIDKSKVILFGHSRLGKTSLWAGAIDQRFAAVISNNSGSGGAALSKRKFGQEIGTFCGKQPHWFCKNLCQYDNREENLPADQHELIGLIAPRPVYIASAAEDLWADPHGEFLTAFYATPIYNLFGKEGIPENKMPGINQPVHNTIAYHIRNGIHDVTDYDWEQYLKWAKTFVLK